MNGLKLVLSKTTFNRILDFSNGLDFYLGYFVKGSPEKRLQEVGFFREFLGGIFSDKLKLVLMNFRCRLLALLLLLIPVLASAQQKDSLVRKLDSLGKNTDSTGGKQKNNINPAFYNENTKITAHVYVVLVADDIKQQVTSPFRATGSDWAKVGAFAVVTTGAILFADKPVNRLAIHIRSNKQVVSASTYVTNFGGLYEAYTLAALGAYGLIFKKDKEQTTTLLATQAYITAAAIETALKYLTGRQRPSYYDPVTGLNNHTFRGPFYHFLKSDNSSYESFPSGHTTVAFAAATVFAMEYKETPVIPIIAYSAATAIGLSRIVQNQHWISDVMVGAALGFLSGRQVVNNYHRYSKIQLGAAKKKNTLSFNLNYFNGTLMPGCIYTFR
jgi:membrane-associated phospholipid phosphatase